MMTLPLHLHLPLPPKMTGSASLAESVHGVRVNVRRSTPPPLGPPLPLFLLLLLLHPSGIMSTWRRLQLDVHLLWRAQPGCDCPAAAFLETVGLWPGGFCMPVCIQGSSGHM